MLFISEISRNPLILIHQNILLLNVFLIKDVATEHGLALGRDDPILILYTINKRLIQENQKAQEDLLNRYKQEFEEMITHWRHDITEKAEQTLNATIIASKELMTKTFEDGIALFHQHIDTTLTQVQTERILTQRLFVWHIVVTAMTVVTMGIAIWFFLYN